MFPVSRSPRRAALDGSTNRTSSTSSTSSRKSQTLLILIGAISLLFSLRNFSLALVDPSSAAAAGAAGTSTATRESSASKRNGQPRNAPNHAGETPTEIEAKEKPRKMKKKEEWIQEKPIGNVKELTERKPSSTSKKKAKEEKEEEKKPSGKANREEKKQRLEERSNKEEPVPTETTLKALEEDSAPREISKEETQAKQKEKETPTLSNLKENLQAAKSNLRSKLLSLYTQEYYEGIFEPSGNSMGDHFFYKSPGQIVSPQNNGNPTGDIFPPSPESKGWNRIVRLLQLKLLQVLVGSNSTHMATTTTLHWTTAGNGQAAGTGNFFRESFTAVLESTLQPAFQSLGIRFTAHNFAIKFQSSGDELALCQAQIYDPSTDLLFWDFHPTDDQDYWKLAMFANRLARQSTKTTALLANTQTKPQTHTLAALEQQGLPVLAKDWKAERTQQLAFPDSAELFQDNKPSSRVQDLLPPLLQYIRCAKVIEDEGPTIRVVVEGGGGLQNKRLCRAFKFNATVCPNRPHKYIWYPSYRTHAVKGYTLAMTLLELVEDALQQIEPTTALQQQHQLERLQAEQTADYEQLQASPPALGSALAKWYKEETTQDKFHDELDLNALFGTAPAWCRTALLPSLSRYYQQHQQQHQQGSTEPNHPIVTTIYNHTYEKGLYLNKLQRHDSKTKGGYRYSDPARADEMVLVTDKGGYFDCPEEPLNVDHLDAFVVTSAMGWRSLTLRPGEGSSPFDVSRAKGWILVCLPNCDNDNKCPDEDLHDRVHDKRVRPDQGDPDRMIAYYGRVEMQVNGIPVTFSNRLIDKKRSNLDNCLALRRDAPRNPHTWNANPDGTYVLRVRIVEGTEWAYVKFSSVILM